MATTNGGGAANASTAWTVEGPEGEDFASPIFGVNERPTIPLADTLAAARAATGLSAAEEGALIWTSNIVVDRLAAAVGPAGLDGLTRDEAGAINIYTQPSPVYKILNKMLFAGDRDPLKQWFSFLNLLLTALHKLPSCPGTYFRGVSADIASQYKKGQTLMWWAFSSSTASIEALGAFMKAGTPRVLFSLDVQRVVDINKFSSFPKEDERLLIAGIPLQVKSTISMGPNLTMVQMTEDLSCPPLIPGFVLKPPPLWEVKDPKEIIFEKAEDEDGDMVKVELGSGSFGRVYAGTFRGHAVAIKQMPVVGEEIIKAFRKEVSITFRLQHKNVALCFGGSIMKKFVRLISERLEASLHDDLHVTKVDMSADYVRNVILQVAQGLAYLHQNNVTHRDLKPGNVMRTVLGILKLIDFGLSSSRSSSMASQGSVSGANKGTAGFMAPELYMVAGGNHTVDTFAFGMLGFETVTRSQPFAGVEVLAVMDLVKAGKRPELPATHPNLSPGIAEVIKACWHQQPERRPDMLMVVANLMAVTDFDAAAAATAPEAASAEDASAAAEAAATVAAAVAEAKKQEKEAKEKAAVAAAAAKQKAAQANEKAAKEKAAQEQAAASSLAASSLVAQIAAMGFSEDDAVAALASTNQNLGAAMEVLLAKSSGGGAAAAAATSTPAVAASAAAKQKAAALQAAPAPLPGWTLNYSDEEQKVFYNRANPQTAVWTHAAMAAIVQKELAPPLANHFFASTPDGGEYKLSEGGPVVTKIKNGTFRGVVADGGGCGPMMDGSINYCEIEVVKNGAGIGTWCFGVCRPEINLNDQASKYFYERDDTWMVYQNNSPRWRLYCKTCKGTGLTIPHRQLNAGDRVGLLLDLANGGTLTVYLDGKPCGTIAEGLVGPLYWCIASAFKGKVVKIHSGLALPTIAASAAAKQKAAALKAAPAPLPGWTLNYSDKEQKVFYNRANPQAAVWTHAQMAGIVQKELAPPLANYFFASMPDGGEWKLSEGGAVVTKIKDSWRGVVADGGGCGPMMDGSINYCEIEIVKNDAGDRDWCFGVCRPEINLNDQVSIDFESREDTWIMKQYNTPQWFLQCNTCKGTGLTIPERQLNAGDRVGLLMDLANGGTLTMYLDGKPCGTIAEGLVGPLYLCIVSYYKGKVLKIHSGLALPPITVSKEAGAAGAAGAAAAAKQKAVQAKEKAAQEQAAASSLAASSLMPRIAAMGFSEDDAVAALASTNQNFDAAMEVLLAKSSGGGAAAQDLARSPPRKGAPPPVADKQASKKAKLAALKAKLKALEDKKKAAAAAESATHVVVAGIVQKELAPPLANYVFGSMPDGGEYELSEGGAVATKSKHMTYRGVVADGGGCAPMVDGRHFWQLEIVKNDADGGSWFFGVCRPGINLNDQASKDFYNQDNTWMMQQSNTPHWGLYDGNTCKGTGLTIPHRQLNAGDRVGLLLDLANGGTLTMYLDGKPCGTIARGLEGPLYPCISSAFVGKAVKILSGLPLPN